MRAAPVLTIVCVAWSTSLPPFIHRIIHAPHLKVYVESNRCAKMHELPAIILNGGQLIFHMAYKVSCLLPALRKQWALTQDELARLLGHANRYQVSSLELEQKEPSMAVLFGLDVIFGRHPKEVFVKFFDAVEEEVVRNLHHFQEELGDDPSPEASRKRQLVSEALSRAVLQTRTNPGYEL